MASRAKFRGFTLIELIVSVGILLILIGAVGVVFRSAGNSVGISQASMEMLSSTAAVQAQLERDVAGMDKDGFLVIRSGTFADSATGYTERCDQISFMSYGQFGHRTGSNSSGSNFTDSTVANAGFVWWGQLAIGQPGANPVPADATNPTKPVSVDQTVKIPLNQVPTGVTESDFILGRHVTLLYPRDATAASGSLAFAGINLPAYENKTTTPVVSAIDYNTANATMFSGEPAADVTESRVDMAGTVPSQVMSFLQQTVLARDATTVRYEADHFCYRYAALKSPYDSSIGMVNGYFRMYPIALQGVSSFAVEWTDGSVFAVGDKDPITGATIQASPANGSLIGTTRWFGLNNPRSGVTTVGAVDPSGTVATVPNGDLYTAIFSFDNKQSWPVALRFRFHVSDPSGRMPAGRDFVQIVKLPS